MLKLSIAPFEIGKKNAMAHKQKKDTLSQIFAILFFSKCIDLSTAPPRYSFYCSAEVDEVRHNS